MRRFEVPQDVHTLPPEKLDYHMKKFLKYQKHKTKFKHPLGYKLTSAGKPVSPIKDETAGIKEGYAGIILDLNGKKGKRKTIESIEIPRAFSPVDTIASAPTPTLSPSKSKKRRPRWDGAPSNPPEYNPLLDQHCMYIKSDAFRNHQLNLKREVSSPQKRALITSIAADLHAAFSDSALSPIYYLRPEYDEKNRELYMSDFTPVPRQKQEIRIDLTAHFGAHKRTWEPISPTKSTKPKKTPNTPSTPVLDSPRNGADQSPRKTPRKSPRSAGTPRKSSSNPPTPRKSPRKSPRSSSSRDAVDRRASLHTPTPANMPWLNSKPSSPYSQLRLPKRNEPLDWSQLNMDVMIDKGVLQQEMGFEDAKVTLKKIWKELRIPADIQQQFQKKHFFPDYAPQDEVAILATINELIMCREKLINIISAIKARELLIAELDGMKSNVPTRSVTPNSTQGAISAEINEREQQRIARRSSLVECSKKLLANISELRDEYGKYYGTELGDKFWYKNKNLLEELNEEMLIL